MGQPKWKEVGNVGDVNWPEYDGGPVMIDETGEYEPELEYVEAAQEEREVDDPRARWTVYRVTLDPEQPWGDEDDLESVADTSGQDPEELATAFASDDPMERAYAYVTWAGHFGWSELDHDPLVLTCAEVNARYPHAKLNCYGAIQTAIEEEVQRMADQNSAEAWSTLSDRVRSDLEAEGYDSESAVGVALFGDTTATNGAVVDDSHANVEDDLKHDGYELAHYGGRVPTDETEVSAEAVVHAVARDLHRSKKDVEAAAKALDWWRDNIVWSSSGHSEAWAKRRAATTGEARRRGPPPPPNVRTPIRRHRRSARPTHSRRR